MDEFYFRKRHVPAFGSWECNNEYEYDNDVQFTQCFESARQAGLFRYSEERDLYVAGDLYENDVLTPAVIVVPRRRRRRRGQRQGKGGESKKERWVVCDSEGELKEPPSPDSATPQRRTTAAKAIDEDLYKISPHHLLPAAQTKRKRAWGGFFSSCLQPTCVC